MYSEAEEQRISRQNKFKQDLQMYRRNQWSVNGFGDELCNQSRIDKSGEVMESNRILQIIAA